MFNVSFTVAQNNLATAIARLKEVADSFSVTPANGQQIVPVPQDSASMSETANVPTKQSKPKRKKPKVRGHRSYGTQQDRARTLLLQIGNGPFWFGSLADEAAKIGVGNTAIYSVLRQEMEAGNLKRLEAGLYQRTGQGFSEQLLASNQ